MRDTYLTDSGASLVFEAHTGRGEGSAANQDRTTPGEVPGAEWVRRAPEIVPIEFSLLSQAMLGGAIYDEILCGIYYGSAGQVFNRPLDGISR